MKKILLFLTLFLMSLLCINVSCGENTNVSNGNISGERLYIEPYLQNVKQDGVTILWWTDKSETENIVSYGSDFQYTVKGTNEYIPVIGKFLHSAVLTGLGQGNSYKYRVISGNIISKTYSFKTAIGRTDNFSFAILGDGRNDNEEIIQRHRHITDMAYKEGVNFAVLAGDGVANGSQESWDSFWRQIVTSSDPNNPGVDFASNIPYYLIVGNHEIYEDSTEEVNNSLTTSMARFKYYVDNPPNNSSNPDWEERYYSFTYGAATFIILDTNNHTAGKVYDESDITPDWEEGSEQYNWLVQELKKAQANSVFTFIVTHPSPYCRGENGRPGIQITGWYLRVLDPLFREYRVDGVFTSHDHLVEHCLTGPAGFEAKMDIHDPDNLNYIVMGNSGEGSSSAVDGWQTWMDILGNDGPPYYSVYFYDWEKTTHASFLYVRITRENNGKWLCTFKIIRDDGQAFNEFSIERTDPLTK